MVKFKLKTNYNTMYITFNINVVTTVKIGCCGTNEIIIEIFYYH